MITQRCNYSCSYCASYDNSQPFLFRSLEEYVNSFKYLSDRFGNKTIRLVFLGGEPTLFKQWVELVNWLTEYNYVPEITTNLSVPVKSYISKLNGKAEKFITASYHTEFTTIPDFVENLKPLADKNYLKGVTLLADPNKWDETLYAIEEFSKIGKVNPVKIKNEFTSSPAISSSFVEYTDDQLKLFEEIEVDDPYITMRVDDKIIHPNILTIRNKYSNFKGMNCAVGQDRLHIKPNGDVYPSACLLNYPRAKMGNIYKEDVIVPKSSIVCPFKECLCGPDIRIEKWA